MIFHTKIPIQKSTKQSVVRGACAVVPHHELPTVPAIAAGIQHRHAQKPWGHVEATARDLDRLENTWIHGYHLVMTNIAMV